MCVSKLSWIEENNSQSTHNKNKAGCSSHASARCLAFDLSGLHVPGLCKRQHLMQNYTTYKLRERGVKQASAKLWFPKQALIFQCTTLLVTISRQGHAICITTVRICIGNISRWEGKILLNLNNKHPPYPCHLTQVVKVTGILGLQWHEVPIITLSCFPGKTPGALDHQGKWRGEGDPPQNSNDPCKRSTLWIKSDTGYP